MFISTILVLYINPPSRPSHPSRTRIAAWCYIRLRQHYSDLDSEATYWIAVRWTDTNVLKYFVDDNKAMYGASLYSCKNKSHLGTNCFALTAVEENCNARQMRTGLCARHVRCMCRMVERRMRQKGVKRWPQHHDACPRLHFCNWPENMTREGVKNQFVWLFRIGGAGKES